MSLDLTGIDNENEFFSQHYMDALLDRDLGNEYETPQGWDRIKTAWQRGLKEWQETPDLEHSLGALSPILTNLGYAPQFQVWSCAGWLIGVWAMLAKDGQSSPELIVLPVDLPVLNDDAAIQDPLCWSIQGILGMNAEDVLGKVIFSAEAPPRWVILCNPWQAVLIERGKWSHKRALRFDWETILGRRAPTTLKAMSALLSRASLVPDSGQALLDALDENSHRHAYGVSEDLKYALRESIEALGNEAIFYLANIKKEKVYGELDAGSLSRECLRVMYRLLFLLYLEARPELGYIPDAELYRRGYGLDLLRDLELRALTGDEARNGYFFHESITRLFSLIDSGYPEDQGHRALAMEDSLRIAPLKSHLFDPGRTPIFNRVKIRNVVWQEIIRSMSLSKPRNRRQRGRISYAQLGINQLGAVYEALLSFQGFFAEEDLLEVRKAGNRSADDADHVDDDADGDGGNDAADAAAGDFQENDDPLANAYFVPAREQARFRPSEIVVEDGRPKTYPRGSFIYRLAGRDRQKSASYYTPEALTQCLVKYALKELLKDKKADDILSLKICEPAMGSAAFLNEAVNQLAEAYLERKQAEVGARISQADYGAERQRVKMYLADNNVFGIDLNPTAVELAEVSLWLSNIYSGAFVPWFGLQLYCGNSLIGARREAGPAGGPYKPLRHGEKLPQGHIWHFLAGDPAMANYKDKVVKEMEGDALKTLTEWRKRLNKPLDDEETERLVSLSRQIDTLWKDHTDMLRKARAKTTDALSVWPAHPSQSVVRSTAEKDRILQHELLSETMKNSSPYRRLKLILDYWCALWFWPIDKAKQAPDREEWWTHLELIAFGNVWKPNVVREQALLFAETIEAEDVERLKDHTGFVDVDALSEQFPALKTVREIAERYRFFHWDLEFADILADRGGFDLILGNPPWIKVEWYETGLLSDYDPMVAVRKLTALQTTQARNGIFGKVPEARAAYLSEYVGQDSIAGFLASPSNYPLLSGAPNLYKCFLPQAWHYGVGVSAFLHPESVYDDPKGALLRSELYHRLRYHFQFQNELTLFAEVDHHAKFSMNIYSNPVNNISFDHLANLYAPSTIAQCYDHDGSGKVPGIKTDENSWNTAGHAGRIIHVDENALEIFAKAFDDDTTAPSEARLP